MRYREPRARPARAGTGAGVVKDGDFGMAPTRACRDRGYGVDDFPITPDPDPRAGTWVPDALTASAGRGSNQRGGLDFP